eukprot:3155187-Pyramimonas_sp.AAC.1
MAPAVPSRRLGGHQQYPANHPADDGRDHVITARETWRGRGGAADHSSGGVSHSADAGVSRGLRRDDGQYFGAAAQGQSGDQPEGFTAGRTTPTTTTAAEHLNTTAEQQWDLL